MKNFFLKIKQALPQDRKTQIVLSVLVLGGILAAIAIGVFVNNFVAGMTIVKLPGVAVVQPLEQDPALTPGAEATDETAIMPDLVELEPWDGKTRVNVLVMGLDARDLEDYKAPRTDSMILFTFDPVALTAGMISIPRDLWVKIPGSEYGKINTAYSIGEIYKLPGGGPQLAVDTVEDLLGVPIQYYAQIDFVAFVKLIDRIKGVKIDVPYSIQLDVVDTKISMWIEPGTYTLPGDLALAYMRSRGTAGGDFDRAQRQQQVILAIRDRVLEFDMMPNLIANAPAIYADLSYGIRTNLGADQVLQLALKILDVPRDQIMHKVIDNTYVNFGKSPEGLDILRPIPDRIRELRDEVFYGSESSGQTVQDQESLLQDENARVAVRNGSTTADIGTRTSAYLSGQGINIVDENETGYQTYTRITLYGSKPYTLSYLAKTFNITSNNIYYAYDPNAQLDILVELGDDWAASNTLP